MSRRLDAADLHEETVTAARARSGADKVRDSLRLFDRTWTMMSAGVRHEQDRADPAEILRIVRARLRVARDLEREP